MLLPKSCGCSKRKISLALMLTFKNLPQCSSIGNLLYNPRVVKFIYTQRFNLKFNISNQPQAEILV